MASQSNQPKSIHEFTIKTEYSTEMKPHMKHAKHVQDPCSRDCLDMISSLPDELLSHILSSLPTRCAVRTSILSTRWRYLFTLTNCLCFDDAPCIEEAQKIMFRKFVYNVLELHQTSPIKIFSLACREPYDLSDLNAWVSKAVQKGVKELQYQVGVKELQYQYGEQEDWLSDGFFMCETLVKLEISIYPMYEAEIPRSAWLPSLKILHLKGIIFSDFESLEILFSTCELLEELTMNYCECLTTDGERHYVVSSGLLKVLKVKGYRSEFGLLEIDAPNLAYLTYSSSCGVKLVPSWKDSCSFVNAKLTFNYIVRYASSDESDDSLIDMYERELLKDAAGRCTVLSLLDSVQPLLTLADNEQMPDFHRLSKLHLSYCPYDAWKYLTCLLDRSPQLETVVFKEGVLQGFHDCKGPAESHSSDPEPHNNDPSLTSLSLNPFSRRAKVIVVRKFCGHGGSLILLGHLLRNAPSLQRLVVYMRDTFNADEQRQISKKLQMLPRASTDSCIELK